MGPLLYGLDIVKSSRPGFTKRSLDRQGMVLKFLQDLTETLLFSHKLSTSKK
jgi:hypothetical protein